MKIKGLALAAISDHPPHSSSKELLEMPGQRAAKAFDAASEALE